MQEVWKDIEGYEGAYRVSNLGHILSVRFGPKSNSVPVNPVSKIMRQSRSSSGYLHVQLYKNGKSSTKLVHILVAQAFIPNPENKPEVNHIDGNKNNNRVDNLEWSTKSENQRHAINIGLRQASPNIGKIGELSKSSKPVLQYDLQGNFVKKWSSYADAARYYGCSYTSIGNCAHGRHKTCQGYMWRPYDSGEIPQTIPPVKRLTGGRSGKYGPQKNKRHCKPINQFSLDGKLIKTWNNYRDLQETTGYDNGNIYACINGKLKTAYGYIWKYAEP